VGNFKRVFFSKLENPHLCCSCADPFNSVDFRDYSIYHCPGVMNNGMFHGGVALLIKNIFAHKHIERNTSQQAVAARIICFKSITVCSLCLPHIKMDKNDLEDLNNQLPLPIVLLGDFNTHSNDWGCLRNDSKGKMISDLMLHRNLSLLNDGSVTYLHSGSVSQSAIDLSICDPSLYLDLSWKVHEDLCGSDHFPIIIYSDRAVPSVTNRAWKLSKADWNIFSHKAASDLKADYIVNKQIQACKAQHYMV